MGYILVIDDDKGEREKTRLVLSVKGYKAKFSGSWEEARTLFDGDLDWDLVIVRVAMEEVNGNDIARYIRQSKKPRTPILAIAVAEDDIDQKVFSDVLMTPCKLEALGEKIAPIVPPPPPR